MRRLLQPWMLLICLVLCTGAAGAITETEVRQLITKLDQAVQAQDVNALAQLLSPNVRIRVDIASPAGKQRWTPDRAEYLRHMQRGWASVSEYSYQRNNVHIRIEAGQATVSGEITERMTMQGQSVVSHAREIASIRRIDGVLQIVAVLGEVSL